VRERVEAIIQHPRGDWLEFADPARVVIADAPHAVRSALDDVERLTRDMGLHAVDFVSYEAGLAFDLATRPLNTAIRWPGLAFSKRKTCAQQPRSLFRAITSWGHSVQRSTGKRSSEHFLSSRSISQRATPIRSISPSKSWVNFDGTREPSLPT
jgi:hypothetical protein